MEKGQKKGRLTSISVICIIIIVILIVLFFLFNGRETYISNDSMDEPVVALVCTAGNLEDSFYTSDITTTITNEIKIAFKGNTFRKIFYSYKGVYSSTDLASQDEIRLHAKYNIYMGQNNVSQESLSPSYSVANNKLGITLYADNYDLITRITGTLFFIDSNETEEYKTYDIYKLKKFYESKDFSCEINK